MTLRHLASLAALLVVFAAGCLERVMLYAPPAALASGANVEVRRAYVAGDRLFVETYIMNASKETMRIDRDKFSLRLPNGVVLPRSVGTTSTHNIYALQPGEGHQVNVDFHADVLSSVTRATLVVGGIFAGTELAPRPAGEIPLGATPAAAPPPPDAPGPPPPPPN